MTQEQAVLAVVRLIGDQDVQVTAQHASSTSAAVAVRIGRALLYLNDQATAAHFHKTWFDAAELDGEDQFALRPCACGCSELTDRDFLPGHDVRAMQDRVRTYFAGSPLKFITWIDHHL